MMTATITEITTHTTTTIEEIVANFKSRMTDALTLPTMKAAELTLMINPTNQRNRDF